MTLPKQMLYDKTCKDRVDRLDAKYPHMVHPRMALFLERKQAANFCVIVSNQGELIRLLCRSLKHVSTEICGCKLTHG